MSNLITLEAIEEELTREFAPVSLQIGDEEFILRNLLRIDAADRRAVMEKLGELEGLEAASSGAEIDEHAIVDVAQSVLRTITAEARGDRLVELLGGDMLRTTRVLQKWVEATQPGEAPSSPA